MYYSYGARIPCTILQRGYDLERSIGIFKFKKRTFLYTDIHENRYTRLCTRNFPNSSHCPGCKWIEQWCFVSSDTQSYTFNAKPTFPFCLRSCVNRCRLNYPRAHCRETTAPSKYYRRRVKVINESNGSCVRRARFVEL